jgi:RNA recognition motif-containing protein
MPYICIDGFPKSVRAHDLSILVSAITPPTWATVIVDPTGESLRFGIAEVASEREAARVVDELDGKAFCEAYLRVAVIDEQALQRCPLLWEQLQATRAATTPPPTSSPRDEAEAAPPHRAAGL